MNPVSSVTFTTQGALRKSALRQANQRLVLNAIRENPHLSRVEISRITGLSPSSVTFIVKRLSKDKLIREQKVNGSAPQVGRPPTILRLQPSARYAVAVDISPTGSRVALADWTGHILEMQRVDWGTDPETLLRTLHGAVRNFVSSKPGHRILGVGVSVPGTWDDKTRTVTSAVNLGWKDVAVAPLLEKGFDVPMYFDNNANLSALGERWFRSQGARPLENFVFVTLGGGIGTGIIVAGHIVHGAFGRAGEFGHMTVFPDGRRCLCGNLGCWEEYASDRALVRIYQEKTDRKLQLHAVIERAQRGEAAAIESLLEAGRHLALGLANLVIGLNPEAIVVDNWAASAWDIIDKPVWEVLRQRVPAAWLEGIRVYPSAHAEDSSLLGAVALALTRYFHSFDHSEPDEARNFVQMRG
ncbi:MAG: ROK family transcriptional regulator [Bryobacterales bacterium]|nr:ROK family transcriptional regulator [Bryobacterales bacterium]